MYEYKAKLLRVVDGDTIDVSLSVGLDIYFNVRLRLYGINCPETYGVKKDSLEYQEGKKATEYVIKMLTNKDFIVKTYKDKTGKYGRYLADVIVDDVNINQEMVKLGLAQPYK